MTVERLSQVHERRPFQPFTIHLADGTSVRVRHPEFLMRTAGGRTIHVATGKSEEAEIIDLLLVTKLTVGEKSGRGNGRSHN
jgi:hypothetical protein